MMIRSATIFDTGLRALCLALSLLPALPGRVAAQDTVRVAVSDAPTIALRALQEGQPRLALQLAEGLLQRDPKDARAHFIIAQARMQLGQYAEGRRAAALAYRHADTKLQKFQAAQLAAKLSVAGKDNGLAQLWLRRSLLHLPHESYRERVVKDYKILRAITPWSVSAQFSLAPSNNINNGADSPYSIVDGLPLVGYLDGRYQALSGLRATASLSWSRRISGSKTHDTRLTGRYYAQRVRLSDDARVQAPEAENADFAFDQLEFGLRHTARTKGGTLGYTAGIGRSWYGQSPYQWVYEAGVSRGFDLPGAAALQLSAQLQHRVPDAAAMNPVDTLDLKAQYARKLASGDRLRVGLSLTGADSDTANARQHRATGYVGYSLAEPVGPAKVSASIGASLQRYPDYSVVFWHVPGGREDRSVFGSVDFSFHRLDYAGFVPTLTLQARSTQSNVSRFETNEMSLSFGISSSF